MDTKGQGVAHEIWGMEKRDINVDTGADATWQQRVLSLYFFSLVQLLPIRSPMHDMKPFYISETMTHLQFFHRVFVWHQPLFVHTWCIWIRHGS